MISDNSGFATLTSFQSCELFSFSAKLLDLPAQAAHFLYNLRVVLRHVVGHNIVRALCGKHYPEELHLVTARKSFDFYDLAFLFFQFRLCQCIHAPVRLGRI